MVKGTSMPSVAKQPIAKTICGGDYKIFEIDMSAAFALFLSV
jgi:hypothetical protein